MFQFLTINMRGVDHESGASRSLYVRGQCRDRLREVPQENWQKYVKVPQENWQKCIKVPKENWQKVWKFTLKEVSLQQIFMIKV